MKRFSFAVFSLLLIAAVTGCNTMQGMGADLQRGGEALKRAATPKSGNDSMYGN